MLQRNHSFFFIQLSARFTSEIKNKMCNSFFMVKVKLKREIDIENKKKEMNRETRSHKEGAERKRTHKIYKML